jgi:hypothetical protein
MKMGRVCARPIVPIKLERVLVHRVEQRIFLVAQG